VTGGFRAFWLLINIYHITDLTPAAIKARGGFWFLVFGLICRHTASNPITAEMDLGHMNVG